MCLTSIGLITGVPFWNTSHITVHFRDSNEEKKPGISSETTLRGLLFSFLGGYSVTFFPWWLYETCVSCCTSAWFMSVPSAISGSLRRAFQQKNWRGECFTSNNACRPQSPPARASHLTDFQSIKVTQYHNQHTFGQKLEQSTRSLQIQ